MAVELLEGNIESRHYPCSQASVSHQIVLRVIELEVYDLADSICILLAEIIEDIEQSGIGLHFHAFGLGRNEMNIVASFVLVGATWWERYMSLTCGTISGAYLLDRISLGGCFSNMGCRK